MDWKGELTMNTVKFLEYARGKGLSVSFVSCPAKIKIYRQDGVLVAEINRQKECCFQIFEGMKNVRSKAMLMRHISLYSMTPIERRILK